ncbi:TetR/AcrR family transcriptional regulator [Pleurocapsa sp. PCC 7319]|uniref:TetR/AcrR family transcriptional regulator n=1 Tax=Pleurocapsa sp. PCC 7319 TaxID=118161 RepID=UPI00034B7924|nr:TetR/AcrR family transcriptional regulator [Pleurocapsa sp. PCC 7319]
MGKDNRRSEVTEAAWRVIIKEGLDKTSMRAIAKELGSSTGVVTHYFRDKNELMLFVLERIFENLHEEMESSIKEQQGIKKLEQMILAALPLKPRSLDGWKVWVAFLGNAIGREKLILEHQKRYDFLRQIISQELADLQAEKLIQADLDLTLEANALIALVDGIGTGVVINPLQFSSEQQIYLVKRHIKALLPTFRKY